MDPVRRLGLNQGGYFGERIDIHALLAEIEEAAQAHGWTRDVLDTGDGPPLLAFRRSAPQQSRRRVYISAGIHGDEPAGPLAIRELIRANAWDDGTDLWVCPCLNPTGFAQGRRFNGAGVDLNRDYRELQSSEVRAHVSWLQQQPAFDCALCLHEDWEAHGFYVYELSRERSGEMARRVLAVVGRDFPIDVSETIDGWPADRGSILPEFDPNARSDWAEAIYLFVHKTPVCCTLEAPSDFPLRARTAALVAGVHAALKG